MGRPDRGPAGTGAHFHGFGGCVMRAGAARGHVGHFHEAGFYGSDAEFAALIVPFVEEGVAAGEPVIIGYDDRKAGLLRSWLADPSAVEFIADRGLYAAPARAIATYRRLFEFHAAMGAGQIRIAGDVPHPGNGGRFEGWDRYECAVNTVWQDFPVWGLCLYDTATALQDLIIGASEAVSNALRHGQPPATVRIWATPDRIVVSVHDPGPGPADPLAGMVPAAHSPSNSGLGLWVMHQLDIDTALIHTGDGFTVRLRAGSMPD